MSSTSLGLYNCWDGSSCREWQEYELVFLTYIWVWEGILVNCGVLRSALGFWEGRDRSLL